MVEAKKIIVFKTFEEYLTKIFNMNQEDKAFYFQTSFCNNKQLKSISHTEIKFRDESKIYCISTGRNKRLIDESLIRLFLSDICELGRKIFSDDVSEVKVSHIRTNMEENGKIFIVVSWINKKEEDMKINQISILKQFPFVENDWNRQAYTN